MNIIFLSKTLLTGRTDPRHLLKLFPLAAAPPETQTQDTPEKRTEERLQEVQKSLERVEMSHAHTGDEASILKFGEEYQRYATVEDLGETAKTFHDRAGQFHESQFSTDILTIFQYFSEPSWHLNHNAGDGGILVRAVVVSFI